MPAGRHCEGMAAAEEGFGGEDGVGIAAVKELEGLTDVFAVDYFGLDRGPDAGMLQSLLGGNAIGSEFRVGQRHCVNGAISQIFKIMRLPIFPEQAEAAFGVGPDSVGAEFAGLGELVYVGSVGGEEDIVRGAVFNLLFEDGTAGRHETDVEGGVLLGEGGREWALQGREVGGGGDCECILRNTRKRQKKQQAT